MFYDAIACLSDGVWFSNETSVIEAWAVWTQNYFLALHLAGTGDVERQTRCPIQILASLIKRRGDKRRGVIKSMRALICPLTSPSVGSGMQMLMG